MRYLGFVIGSLVTLVVATAIPQFAAAAPTPTATQPLDDPLEILSPRQARTEQEEDRLAAAAHFSAGRMLEQRQMLPEALRQYERAIRYDPDATPVLRELVPLAFTIDRPEEGLRYAVKYIEQNSVDDAILVRAAEYLAEAGEWKRALKLYQHLAETLAKEKPSPQLIAVQMQLGRLYFLNEQFAESATAFKQVMDALEQPKQSGLDAKSRRVILGDDGAIYELFGAAFLEANQPDNARVAFERFNKLKPDEPTLAVNLARVELAADKPQAALDQLQKYFDAESTTKGVVPYELLAKSLKQLKQDDQLISRLEALHKAQPKNTLLAYFLGQQYREAGKLDKAQPLLEAALADKSSEQAYPALIDVYRRTNQPEALLKVLAQVAEKSGSLSIVEASAQEIIKDEKLLSAILEAAEKQHSAAQANDQFALRVAALLAAEAKRWSDAEKLFNLAIKANPKSASELLLVWGVGLLMDNKAAEAAAIFQRGIDEKVLPDDNPAFHFYLAGALEMQGQTDEALAAARTAAEKQPKNPEMAGRPAWILYHAKRYDDAAKAYQELVEKFEDDFTTDGAREILPGPRGAVEHLRAEKREQASRRMAGASAR